MSIAALCQGYHVLVEKPVAGSVAEVDEMIAARISSGRQCAVGFQQVYSPVIQRLKSYICEGRLGQVRRIHTMALWPRLPAYYARNNWAGKLSCAGRPVYDSPFNNALAHQVMNMLYLASSQPARAAYPAMTEAELFRTYNIESFDTGCMRLVTDSSAELVFVASHACPANIGPTMRLEADLATVNCEIERIATIHYANGSMETLEWDDARTHMLDNIVEAIDTPAVSPLCTLEIARAQVACTEAIHQAAEIRTIPQALISQLVDGQLVIEGIQEAVQGVYQSGKLFSELGVLFA
jgi:predicted dehydrogenase